MGFSRRSPDSKYPPLSPAEKRELRALEPMTCECCRRRKGTRSKNGVWCCAPCTGAAAEMEHPRLDPAVARCRAERSKRRAS